MSTWGEEARLKNYAAIFLDHNLFAHLYNHKGSGSHENNGHISRREDSRRRESRSQREERRNAEDIEANGRMMMRGQEVDSIAVSIFTDILVELTDTVSQTLLWYFDEDLVYQEVEVEEMVEKSEKNLSRKWKNTLTSVSAVEKMRWAAINLWSDVEVIITPLCNLDLQIDGEFQITSKTKKVQMEVGIECTPTIMQKNTPISIKAAP